MDRILDVSEKHLVVGHIYKMTNIITGKSYVGQTRSHRLNHNKYRPFGYMGRFKDHENECYTKKSSGSKCLNAAILEHGLNSFNCELILECPIEEMDENEIKYISYFNTLYPNGYNLTAGGKSVKCVITEPFVAFAERPKNTARSEETKQKMSKSLKTALNNEETKLKRMQYAHKQHELVKFEKFKYATIDASNIEKYIYIRTNHVKNYDFIKINIGGVVTTFVSKYEPIEKVKERAIEFIKSLIKWQHDQTAGTS